MLGDNWGGDTVANLTAAERALRAKLIAKYPDFVLAGDTYARMYGMQFTDALRFVLGSSGDGYSPTMRDEVMTEIVATETADQQPGTLNLSQIPWVPIAIGAALLMVLK